MTQQPVEPWSDADAALLELGRRLQRQGYRFITVTPQTHAVQLRRRPGALAEDRRDVFGWCRPFRKGLLTPPEFTLMQRAGVLQHVADGRWRSTMRWSSFGDFLFVHSAYPTDAPDAVFFGPDTYRFAQAIEAHLQQYPGPVRRAVDIGCGSGAGALSAALSLRIVDEALARLAPGGRLLLYTGVAMIAGEDPFLRALQPRLEAQAGAWSYREIDPDVFGEELLKPGYAAVERIAAVVLTVCRS